jgi:translation initiation factor 5
MINIGGDKADKNYRYQMPAIQVKGEGRGNGVKTVVTNLTPIATALRTPPEYPTKFFGIELGAISSWDPKLERCIVNGQHTAADMQRVLEKFVELFIICPRCRLHEIKMSVSTKAGKIKLDCAACGFNGQLATTHRLTSYILAHPPPKNRHDTQKKDADAEGGDDAATGAALEDEIAAAAATKTRRSKKAEETWSVDTSEEAQQARKVAFFAATPEELEKQRRVDEILSHAKAAGILDAPSTVLKVFVASKDRVTDEVVAEARRLQISRGLDDAQKVKVVLEAFIDPTDPRTVHQQFEAQAPLLSRFVTDRASALQLIGCVEDFIGEVHPELLPRTPLVIKALYDAEVLDEGAIVAWHESPPETSWLVKKDVAAAVRAKATPFVDWLKEAEDDDEDEDDE